MASETAEVLVVGGGLLGTSIAYQLARERVKVTLLEQNAVGSGTSNHGSGAIGLPEHYVDPPELANLIWKSSQVQMEVTPQIADESGIDVIYMKRDREVTVATTDEAWTHLQRLSRTRVDFLSTTGTSSWGKVDLPTGEEVRRIEPGLGSEIEIYGAEYRTGAIAGAWVDPYRLNLAYAQLAHRHGARVRTGTVAGVLTDGARVRGVRTTDGEQVQSDHVVLAMGNWTPMAEQWFGVPLPVLAIKGHEVRLKCEDQPVSSLRVQGIEVPPLRDPLIILRGDGVYTIGHTTQETFVWDPTGSRDRAFHFDDTIERRATDLILEYAVKLVPALAKGRVIGYVAGPRPIPPDGLPMIGPVPGWEGAYVCVGNPAIMTSCYWGQVMRDLVLGRPLDFSLEPFLPDRFGEGMPLRGRYGIMAFDVT